MRIISLVPSQTELLADLGLDDEVVGITDYCVHPADWLERKPSVGGTKRVKVDRVRELKPDLVIANKEENVREQVLEIAEFTRVEVTDVVDLPSALQMIQDVGQWVGRDEQAAELVSEIQTAFQDLESRPKSGERVLYLIWRKPYMSVGHDTFIHDMIIRAGWQNVCADQTRYPSLSADEIRALNPDRILLSSEPFPFTESHFAEFAEICPNAQIQIVDGEAFSWYGSRLRLFPDTIA